MRILPLRQKTLVVFAMALMSAAKNLSLEAVRRGAAGVEGPGPEVHSRAGSFVYFRQACHDLKYTNNFARIAAVPLYEKMLGYV